MIDNKEVYSTVEFEQWANRSQLVEEERILIRQYLDKEGRTLDAGTGGGRIPLAMRELGFVSLYAFDFVPGFIERARARDKDHAIHFDVQDATCLSYEDDFFDQLIYIQNIICMIESEQGRLTAVREAYRILRSGGVAFFSFLSFEVRCQSAVYRAFLSYLNVFRKLRGSPRPLQYLPWLKHGKRFNLGTLYDVRPHVYWFKCEEAAALLEGVGFHVEAIGSRRQVEEGRMWNSPAEISPESLGGVLYCICRK